jgi:Rho-binding antiterminator
MNQQQLPYRSINCSSYDQLEAYATQRTHCLIVYREHNVERHTEGIIVDLVAQNGAEYLKLDTAAVIRLDHLISVNGVAIHYAC